MADPALTQGRTAKEERALRRWKPARRWYHPPLAALVILTSKLITTRLNRLSIDGLDRFEAAQRIRGGRGLLTFSNHVSMLDDPLLVANFSPRRYEEIRWVASDALNFFDSAVKAWFFTAGKCVPIVRGAGVDQSGYHFLRDRLRDGDWVHVFPEGGRTRDANARLSSSFRLGIGRLIAETTPIALPFYHDGMQEVLPVGAALPRRGHEIRLLFGEHRDCDPAFLSSIGGSSDRERWGHLARWSYEQLRRLEIELRGEAGASGDAR